MRFTTTSNLFETTHFLHQHMKCKNNIDVVYFDFTKAFDQVDHYILATTIAKIVTIMIFITNRSYYILKCEGNVFNLEFTAKSSVPQESHCGPLLFLLMCTDIVV